MHFLLSFVIFSPSFFRAPDPPSFEATTQKGAVKKGRQDALALAFFFSFLPLFGHPRWWNCGSYYFPAPEHVNVDTRT
ncbi:hypothetical protein FN846DRAFT_958372 [Sphaerosporella brunnea]|uniref:Uncharacterized protein n=1 Tax=Sphaerosporella brunnea TaxID=1250544 RepID=A0A5J5ER13_9PEZI|nr:hypothetical protein FN846DRAFT_958372 [Sphaerosporella brunnea]